MSATMPTGIPYSHCCEPTAMYHDTGSSSSCANTATPRPHRRPVHSAHADASTPPPMIANHAALPKPLTIPCSAPASPRTTNTTAATSPIAPSSATNTAA